ncbi:subtilisin-like protease [Fusarium austroafricanum]|uniref:Subtilisin-like protease n=1 Tax=Fusarium austroafricanum TaxID=2364996 RepID=A0A8H4KR61_9HYPO|nr:subtilisin-like protease [Fusarium austroafricanum]
MRLAPFLALLPFTLAAPAKRSEPAPLLKPRDGTPIEGKYIVKLADGMKISSVSSVVVTGAADKADHKFSNVFHGFSGSMTDQDVEALRNDPAVEYIEQDAVYTAGGFKTQTDATWGLARLSNTNPGSTKYTYDSTAGQGVCAYVIDTGIYTNHREFEGRASFLANYVTNSNTDDHGHGTHVAGTIGSRAYGVAKQVKLFAVKVLDSNMRGTTSQILAGMNFALNDSKTRKGCPRGFVVNMSVGGPKSTAFDTAARNIVNAGLFMGAAAMNDATDASNISPASEPSVCTVGATTSNDRLASFSNYGKALDLLAPGDSITSTWNNGGWRVYSGTSMATPHVVGLAAYFMGLGRSASGLCAYMASKSLSNRISGVPSGTVNLLIHNNA